MAGTTVNWKDDSERNHDIVYRFEKAFTEGKNPQVKDYLEGEGPSRWRLLMELLHSNLELRIRAGQSLRVQDYLKEHGELAQHPDDLANLIKTEIRCLRQMGIYPLLHKYQADYGSIVGKRVEELFAQESRGTREAKIGSTIAGKYKLLAELGEGGMGSVYAAEQTQPVRRTVAIKLIKPGMDSSGVLARFEAERQALAMMDHPNIARMLDGGITEDGQPYFVMEQVKGLPITKFCDQERLSLDDRIELFMAVCQGVQHAHQKGIIHRDLKPSNILVTLIDGKPVPKVIDFGVAKALHQKLTDKTMYTEAGRMVGTLEYMAPEQADFNNLDVDTRADVYALGVVLYELLTGQVPFTSKELRSAAYDEMLRIIREMEPPRPSTKLSSSVDLPKVASLRQVDPKQLTSVVAGELDWIVMKCLEKERGRRYETANALGRELGRYLADEPVEARPPSAGYRLGKFVRRNRGKVLSAVLLIITLLAGVVTSLWQMKRALDAEQLAKTNLDFAVKERNTSLAVRNIFMNEILSQADPQQQARQSLLLGIKEAEIEADPRMSVILKRASQLLSPDNIAKLLPDEPVLQAELLYIVGTTYRNSSAAGDINHQTAISLLRRAEEIQIKHLGRTSYDLLLTQNEIAWTLKLAGNTLESVDMFRTILSTFNSVLENDTGKRHAILDNYAISLTDAYKLNGNDNLIKESIAILENVIAEKSTSIGLEAPSTLLSKHRLAMAFAASKDYVKAETLNRSVLLSREKVLGYNDPFTLQTRQNLAGVLRARGKHKEAISLLEQVYESMVKVYGRNDSQTTLIALGNLSGSLVSSGEFQKAKTKLLLLLESRITREGRHHPSTVNTLIMLGQANAGLKNYADAIQNYEQVIESIDKKLYPYAFNINVVENLAELYESNGKNDASLQLRKSQLQYIASKFGKQSMEYKLMLVGIGNCLTRAKMFSESSDYLRQCIDIAKEKPGDWVLHYAECLLGQALLNQGKHQQAQELLLRGYEGAKATEKILPNDRKHILKDTAAQLVKLYSENNQLDELKKWRELAISPVDLMTQKWFIKPDPYMSGTQEKWHTQPRDKSWMPFDLRRPWRQQGIGGPHEWFWLRVEVVVPKDWNAGNYYLYCKGVDQYGEFYDGNDYLGSIGDIQLGRSAFVWPAQFKLKQHKPGDTIQITTRVMSKGTYAGIYRTAFLFHTQGSNLNEDYSGQLKADEQRIITEIASSKTNYSNLHSYRDNIAVAHEYFKDYPKAEKMLRDNVRDVMNKKCGEWFPGSGLLALSINLGNQGKTEEALALLDQSITIQDSAMPNDWRTANSHLLCGVLCTKLKRYDDARKHLALAYKGFVREHKYLPRNADYIALSLQQLIQLNTETKNLAEAARWKNILDAHRKKYPHPATGQGS